MGFDAYNETYVNMIEAGIIDPVKVTRSALQNATSVASTMLTTELKLISRKTLQQCQQAEQEWAAEWASKE